MSEVKDVVKEEVVEKPKMKKLGVKDSRTIVKFLAKTNLKDEIFELLTPQDLSPVYELEVKNWAEFRERLELTREELIEIQQAYGNLETACVFNALGTRTYPKARTQAELNYQIVTIAYSLLDDDSRYEATIELLGNLYEKTTDEIEEMSLEDIVTMITGVVSGSDFFS